MTRTRSERAWTLIGAAALALTVGVMIRRTSRVPMAATEEMRDAVAAPVSPALAGARVDQGWFATPSSRRAEAEKALLSSRRNRAASVSAQ